MKQQRVADLAQLAEHVTSNDEVGGSNPLVSMKQDLTGRVRSFFVKYRILDNF